MWVTFTFDKSTYVKILFILFSNFFGIVIEVKLLHSQKAKIPIAKKEWLKIISLPLFPDLKLSKVNFIVRALKNFDKNFDKY